MSKYKSTKIKSLSEVIQKRRHLKNNGLVHGRDYVIETLHDEDGGYVTGYTLYYEFDEETATYYKIIGALP